MERTAKKRMLRSRGRHPTALTQRAARAKQGLFGGNKNSAALGGADLLQSPDGIDIIVGGAVVEILAAFAWHA
jgi:hypothetical protein